MAQLLDQYPTEVQHTSADMAADKCHLILETEVDCLQLVGSCSRGFCMRTSITGFTWSVFFLCLAFCLVADAVAYSSHLKCEIESESAVC